MRLPFLLKVLAVEQPLSLQTHPDEHRAAAIFEQERGLPAQLRRYSDPYAKPELVCALTRFEALCGIRPTEEIRAWLQEAGLPFPESGADGDSENATRNFFTRWLQQPSARQNEQLSILVGAASRRAPSDPISRLICELAAVWPNDPGLIAPVLLHTVTLEAGEAVFLPAGVLHCYLSGTAIEIMAASDNVVRAGLTHKPVHIEELLNVARFDPEPPPRVSPIANDANQWIYRTPALEFELSRLELASDRPRPIVRLGPSILLCTDGEIRVGDGFESIALERGDACVLPAASPTAVVSGFGTGFLAALPTPGVEPSSPNA